MTEKLDLLFGTKILNRQTNEVGLQSKLGETNSQMEAFGLQHALIKEEVNDSEE